MSSLQQRMRDGDEALRQQTIAEQARRIAELERQRDSVSCDCGAGGESCDAKCSCKCHLERTIAELRQALKKSKSLASIGYRIGEADMLMHDKVGDLYGKMQDELMAEIDALLERTAQ